MVNRADHCEKARLAAAMKAVEKHGLEGCVMTFEANAYAQYADVVIELSYRGHQAQNVVETRQNHRPATLGAVVTMNALGYTKMSS